VERPAAAGAVEREADDRRAPRAGERLRADRAGGGAVVDPDDRQPGPAGPGMDDGG
jgi:hypothetical protein